MDQENNQQLIDAIKELSKYVKTLSSTQKQSGPKSSEFDPKWFIGKLVKDLDIVTRSTAKLSAEQEKLLKESIEAVQNARNANKAYESLTKEAKELLLAEQEARSASEKHTAAVNHDKDSLEKRTQTEIRLDRILTQSVRTLSTFRDSLLSAELSAKKYSSTIDGVTGTLTDAIESTLENLGKTSVAAKASAAALSAAINTLGFAGKAALEYSDRILKAKDDLADFGAIGELTSQDIMDLAKNSQYTSATLQGFTKATKSLSTNIISLGANVNEGVDTFGKLAKVSKDELARYRAMGLSQEQVTQGQADYINLLAKSGVIITQRMRSDDLLAKGSREYLQTISELALYTGMQRDEVKKLVEQSQQYVQLQLKQFTLSKESEALQKKIKNKELTGIDAEAAERRIKQIDTIQKEMSKAVAEAEILGKERGAAVAGYFGTGGMFQSGEQYMQLGTSVESLSKIMRGEKVEGGQVLQQLRDTAERSIQMFGATALAANEDLRKIVGLNDPKVLELLTARSGVDEVRTRADAARTVGAVTEGVAPVITADAAEKLRTDIFNAQNAVQQALDRLARETLPGLQKAVETLSGTVIWAAENIEDSMKDTGLGAAGALSAAMGVIAGLAAYYTYKIGRAVGKIVPTKTRPGTPGPSSTTGTGPGTPTARPVGGTSSLPPGYTRSPGGILIPESVARGTGTGAATSQVPPVQAQPTGVAGAGAAASPWWSRAGRALAALSVFSSLYQTSKVEKQQQEGTISEREAIKEKSGILGALAGGGGAAAIGAGLGQVLIPIPGVGALIGALLGGAVGGTGGYYAGRGIGGLAGPDEQKNADIIERSLETTGNLTDTNGRLQRSTDNLRKQIEELNKLIISEQGPLSQETEKKVDEIVNRAATTAGGRGGARPTQTQQQFLDSMYQTLLKVAKERGLQNPEAIAKLGAAQSALETGYGRSLAGGNNYFGIKDFRGGGTTQQTREFINGRWVTINDRFRRYGSKEESAADYINFLMTNRRYGGVLQSGSVEEAIARMGASGYATDPNYSAKLGSIQRNIGRGDGAAPPVVARPPATAITTTESEADIRGLTIDQIRNHPNYKKYYDEAMRMPGTKPHVAHDLAASKIRSELTRSGGRSTVGPQSSVDGRPQNFAQVQTGAQPTTPNAAVVLAQQDATQTAGGITTPTTAVASAGASPVRERDDTIAVLSEMVRKLSSIDERMASLNGIQETMMHNLV